jgi:hypothetical protein
MAVRLTRRTGLAAIVAAVLAAQSVAADPVRMEKSRCSELVAFYDRWGATRSAETDGARNHVRIGASIECERGRYRVGIDQMEGLLERKRFEVPREIGEAPMYEPIGHDARTADHVGFAGAHASAALRRRASLAIDNPAATGEEPRCLNTPHH